VSDEPQHDLPPAYSHVSTPVQVHRAETSTNAAAGPSTPLSPSSETPLPTSFGAFGRPSNWLLVEKENSALKGTFFIDPTRKVPEPALPPIPETETERHNLMLSTTNATLNAEVYVAVTSQAIPEKAALRTTLKAKSNNGSVTLRIVRIHSWIGSSIGLQYS
jgi:hypothetical protein